MMTAPVMDRLTGQLYHLPGIIAKLGISVANGQKALNAEYLNNIKMIMSMINETLGGVDAAAEAKVEMVKDLLKELAPSRYQFTENQTIGTSNDSGMDNWLTTVKLGVNF